MSPKQLRIRFATSKFGVSRVVSTRNENKKGSGPFSKTSVHDQAALLLSFADIANAEIMTCPSALEDDSEGLPLFPRLDDKEHQSEWLTPRTESLQGLLNTANRVRAVSVDSPTHEVVMDCTGSPRASQEGVVTPMGSPVHRPRVFNRKQRPSMLALHEHVSNKRLGSPGDSPSRSPKSLQGTPAKGIPIKTIFRRKFSWKNYPELEQFLIANREEYLRHSALNYTLQQKQYNNRLTKRLLELATQHGYMFDTTEFSFVTVRDRIRCYYKSFVQSAKKRGILMGYAARKAGLLSEDELEKSAMQGGRIITP